MNSALLTEEQIRQFHDEGVLVVPCFYDLEREILPIQKGIHEIIASLIEYYQLPIEQGPFTPEDFDAGFQALLAADRHLGGVVYDAVKQIPAFVRLVGCVRHEQLFSELRQGAQPAVAAGGYGIRIDNPNEEHYRAPWHQDYPAQLRSPDGLVYWSPLVAMTSALGPVELCLGSHRDGARPLYTHDRDNPTKSGAYALRLVGEAEIIAGYRHSAPLTRPGDLIILDYLLLHTSGYNRSDRSRWSLQMRYFNFKHPQGLQTQWRGSFAAGVSLKDIHPELVVETETQGRLL
ncbi:MAG: phytanoyl-CoA dioxygenase family protein [Gemmatimonadaceae bacterium]|nr:phytanoyl-CoA dioxygenase family protein [Gloeobacterales cyanobacterium ES-bin-141]